MYTSLSVRFLPTRPPHPALRATFPYCSFPFEGKGDRRRMAAVAEVNEGDRRRMAAVEEVVEKNVLPFASDKVHAPTSSGASRHLPLIGEGAEPREIKLSHLIRQLPMRPPHPALRATFPLGGINELALLPLLLLPL